MQNLIEELNNKQKEAVLADDGVDSITITSKEYTEPLTICKSSIRKGNNIRHK